MTEAKRFYLCDKKPGACKGWENGWTKCPDDFCEHTSNAAHARIKTGHHFNLELNSNGEAFFWEVEIDE